MKVPLQCHGQRAGAARARAARGTWHLTAGPPGLDPLFVGTTGTEPWKAPRHLEPGSTDVSNTTSLHRHCGWSIGYNETHTNCSNIHLCNSSHSTAWYLPMYFWQLLHLESRVSTGPNLRSLYARSVQATAKPSCLTALS